MKSTEKKDKPVTANKQSKPKNKTGETKRVRDIAARKQAEETLEQNRIWMENIFNALEEAILVVSPNRELININKAAERIFGYSLDELKNQSTEVLHVDHEHFLEFGQRINKEFEQGKTASFEFKARRKNGEVFPSEHTVALLKNEKGEKLGIVSVIRDITERKQFEDKLRDQELLYSYILHNAVEAIITLDENRNIIHFSKNAEFVFGYTSQEALGKPLDLLIPERFVDIHRRHLENFANAPEHSHTMHERREIFGRRKDGSEFPAEASISKSNINGKLLFAVFLRDISLRKQAKTELRQQERFTSVLNLTVQDMLTAHSPSQAYDSTIKHLTNLFVGEYGFMTWWNPVRRRGELLAATYPHEKTSDEFLLSMEESNLISSLLESGQVLALGDVPSLPHPVTLPHFSGNVPTIQSALLIPLRTKNFIFGMAAILFTSHYLITEEEIFQAQRISEQITVAMRVIQQEIEIRKQLAEADALAGIGSALNQTEAVGLSNVLELIVHSARKLIPEAEQVVLHLLDELGEYLVPASLAGYENAEDSKKKMRLGEGIAGLALESGETINIPDAREDSRFMKLNSNSTVRSLMVFPIVNIHKKVGALSVQSSLPGVFTEHEVALLRRLGVDASIAIENARLLQETQQTLKEINTLYHINQKLITSLEDADLMDTVVHILYNDFKYHHVNIYLIDPENGDLVSKYGRGKAAQDFIKRAARIPVGMGIVGHVAETSHPFITNNVKEVIFYLDDPQLADTTAEMAVPINLNGKTLGVIDVKDRSNIPHHHLSMLIAVADQMALALQKSGLYKGMQESLQQEKTMRDQLVQSERLSAMGRLLASVSHELNNPLQAIQNALYLLKEEGGLSEQGRQDLEIVLAETERMSNLIEQLRATYRPTRSEDLSPAQINSIVEDVYALVSTHLRHNRVAFEFHPEINLPAIPVIVDQIRQVALNLVMNAVEAMQQGGTLTVSTQYLEDAREVLTSISDTGAGIPPSILPNIFEPFTTSKATGTGLGLAICRDIIIKHGGRIAAENNPDGGATFKFWLPAAKETV